MDHSPAPATTLHQSMLFLTEACLAEIPDCAPRHTLIIALPICKMEIIALH